MKKYLHILFLFISIIVSAQMDTEHWFAPMARNADNGKNFMYLYLSTNITTPFDVTIEYYDSAGVLTKDKVQISKGSPGKYLISDFKKNTDNGYIMITDSGTNINTVLKKGLHVYGDQKFFANIRFSEVNHAEIITSKGRAGLGLEFLQIYAPFSSNQTPMNYSIGIIATEENTEVTTTNGKITLNKGESYIMEGFPMDNSMIGQSITANKPISVTNGNFNGQYASASSGSGTDILMDQSVPVERLGNEFILMKGNGGIGNNMEEALIVATKDNTDIYVNGSATKLTTLNKGQYTIIKDTNYILQDATKDVYNMYIKASENIYVYQLLSGSGGTPSGGMNYIPPLNCFLPKKIDEIGLINENPGYYGTTYTDTHPTKLNIITKTGANVKLNGTLLNGTYGPYNVTGTTDWATFMVSDVTGTIVIESDKAVTAGISAGDAAVGYGGYFAGASTLPVISKKGECLPGVVLDVDDTFEKFIWYVKNYSTGLFEPIPGATSYSYTPTAPGEYKCQVETVGCALANTPVFKVLNCSANTVLAKTICDTYTFLPKLSSSSQSLNPSSVKIITNPTIGSISVNSTTGEITYIPKPNSTYTDSFTYYLEGNDPNIPDSEYVTITLNITPLSVYNGISKACVNNGIGRFNIDEVKLTDDATATYRYFKTYNAANTLDTTQEITTLHPYLSDVGIVYVKITNSLGCYKIAEIELRDSQPNVNPNNYDSVHCDENLDGKIEIKFSDISPIIVTNYQDFTIEYYDNPSYTGTPLPDSWSYTADTDVYVRVFSQTSCITAKGIIHFKIGNKISAKDITAIVCDGDYNNTENVVLSSYLPLITSETGYTPTYYFTQNDANNKQNATSANQTITKDTPFYVRLEKSGICSNVVAINLKLNQAKKSTVLKDVTICEGTTILLDVGSGFDHAYWNGDLTKDSQTFSAGVGSYFVDLVSNGCTYRQNVKVSGSPKAIFTISSFNSTNCDEDFDGKIDVDLSTVTPKIISNYNLFTVRYYAQLTDANAGNGNTLPNNWSYSTNTTIYVRVDSNYCPSEIKPIDFKFGNQVPLLLTSASNDVCDDDLDGIKSVNLADYLSQFTADSSVKVDYFSTLTDAQQNKNAIANPVKIQGTQTFYLRFSKSGNCSIIATLNIKVKSPKASTTLFDTEICPGTKTTLDAGTGFDSYSWSNGANTQTITVGAGNYSVTLTYQGCPYKQSVKVSEVELPEIKVIDIQESTVTVTVTGGNPPYRYSLDGIHYQDSNIFTNVSGGQYALYVISKDNCEPITKDFVLIKLYNVITPNGDGLNDYLDYSALGTKSEVKFSVFDRYGKKLFEGNPGNSYTWDGTINGRKLVTSTYWYEIEWKEFGKTTPVIYTGWIFVKNF